MPVLKNARHEAFAQELAKGKTADEAYKLAGFKPNRGNAATLKQKQSISKRVDDPLRSGLLFFDVGASAYSETKQAGGANFLCVNTDVAGTTGTDGNVTVGVISGNLRIENRQGGSQTFRYAFIG